MIFAQKLCTGLSVSAGKIKKVPAKFFFFIVILWIKMLMLLLQKSLHLHKKVLLIRKKKTKDLTEFYSNNIRLFPRSFMPYSC